MELAQGAALHLPLFELNESLHSRDVEQPDFLLEVVLDDELLTHLCQNPAEHESVSLNIPHYELIEQAESVGKLEHSAVLTISHGPLLGAVLECNDGRAFVSPQMDMMPTFDLGDESE